MCIQLSLQSLSTLSVWTNISKTEFRKKKATDEQYFTEVLFIYDALQTGSNFSVCGWNP